MSNFNDKEKPRGEKSPQPQLMVLQYRRQTKAEQICNQNCENNGEKPKAWLPAVVITLVIAVVVIPILIGSLIRWDTALLLSLLSWCGIAVVALFRGLPSVKGSTEGNDLQLPKAE